jgi:4-hydroxyphenylacetate 3-monooxygenase
LGELAAQVGLIEAFVHGMEAKGYDYNGYYMPDRGLLYASQVQSQQLYPRIIQALRELSGGGVLMLPSSIEDFDNPEMVSMIRKTQYSPTLSSEERVQLFKLAWDAVGSEFGSRHTQYEMFYSGPRVVTTGMAYRTFDWKQAIGQVDAVLGSYPLPKDRYAAPVSPAA